jgi:hypothetical protein
MLVVTAPAEVPDIHPSVFLAGGIRNCPHWRVYVVMKLQDLPGVLINPRREVAPVDAEEQIRWEFEALNQADVFSIWFCAAPSNQPIVMYELGRHLARYEAWAGDPRRLSLVIGVEPGYSREEDVRVQVGLVDPEISISNSLDAHVVAIRAAVCALAR